MISKIPGHKGSLGFKVSSISSSESSTAYFSEAAVNDILFSKLRINYTVDQLNLSL